MKIKLDCPCFVLENKNKLICYNSSAKIIISLDYKFIKNIASNYSNLMLFILLNNL